jgi:hypothetical protein
MNNMIIESESEHLPSDNHSYYFQGPVATVYHDVPPNFTDFIAIHAEIRDADDHTRLQNDLIEHMRRLKGNLEARS